MTSDNKVLATHESLERAVSLMARVMGLPVPERELKLVHPEDLVPDQRYITETFVDAEAGHVCLPHEVRENTLFHEASHWVLVNNGYDYRKKGKLIYGRLYEEILAFLAQITLTGTTYKPLLANSCITEQKKKSILDREDYVISREGHLRFLENGGVDMTREQLEAHVMDCGFQIAQIDKKIEEMELISWHFDLEERWFGELKDQNRRGAYLGEFRAFHRTLLEKDLYFRGRVVEGLAQRAAIAHYIHNNKPQDIFYGIIKSNLTQGHDISFAYFMFSAKLAHLVFEEKEIHFYHKPEPKYLTP